MSYLIFADIDVIINSFCTESPTYDEINKIIKDPRCACFCTFKTLEEIERYLKAVEKIVKTLKYYPDNAKNIARKSGDPLLYDFFVRNWINWENYYQKFKENLENNFFLFPEEKLKTYEIQQKVEKCSKKFYPILLKEKKKEKVAFHKAYLISLIKNLEDWYLLTQDEYLKKFSERIITPQEMLMNLL